MFRGNNSPLRDIFILLFEGHVREELWGFCATALTINNSGVLLGNKWRDLEVKGLKKLTVLKLENHKMSVIRDCLFNGFAVNATR
jgi:hypothetical protein